MIIHLDPHLSDAEADQIARQSQALWFREPSQLVLVNSSKQKELPRHLDDLAQAHFVMDSDLQLASRQYRAETRAVDLAPGLTIGGRTGHTLMIAGPCSVESEAQIDQCAQFLHSLGIQLLRGGCYKPRTSPYSFQGLGLAGLKLLAQVREAYGLPVITEVRDATQVADVIAHTDVVQIGAKAMYDHGILRAVGRSGKPVLLKRGFGTTLQEFVQAAEFILSEGNPDVVLCERGIRTFETKSRFTLDLCGVAYLKQHTNLPIVLDPSHAMGYRYGVPDLCRACVAMGVDGLIIETHPKPAQALSDAAQQLDFEAFEAMYHSLEPVAAAVGRKLI